MLFVSLNIRPINMLCNIIMSFDIRAIKVNVHCDESNQIVDIILARYSRSNNI